MMKMKEFREIYCSAWKFFCCSYRYIETNIRSHINFFNQIYENFFYKILLSKTFMSVYCVCIYFIHTFTTSSNIYNKLGHDEKK